MPPRRWDCERCEGWGPASSGRPEPGPVGQRHAAHVVYLGGTSHDDEAAVRPGSGRSPTRRSGGAVEAVDAARGVVVRLSEHRDPGAAGGGDAPTAIVTLGCVHQ